MTILNAIHLAGTITVPDRCDPLTLAIDLDVDGLASWTVALAGDDHGRIVTRSRLAGRPARRGRRVPRPPPPPF